VLLYKSRLPGKLNSSTDFYFIVLGLQSDLKSSSLANFIICVILSMLFLDIFTLRQERRLRVFENRVLRRIFGRKRDEVTGD
jgi:hypothetical protein